ncbi:MULTISPECIES: DUF4919 domain-containing protein [unclassified Flavobacterium]|uniref:DUF4919 domain-containing protein n=1 Tax=unclassified Flavobacterium TaxID=196869 RepID=UPI00129203FD|nr:MULTISPECIES: DUF4919 domain-containing protein [unclassified Flavobacterium]MQP53715.1 DUF4919 domain-containing protein [Flavobacterium sp. LMO9]MQP63656.1 DUF4919 domain-containing protein [Flavobacterium sp. LMO6]
MIKHCLITLIFIFNFTIVFGQTKTEIKVPEFDDNYSKSVKILENGNIDIDYKSFRESFIESEQFKIASEKNTEFRELTIAMYKLMSESEFDSVISYTKKMLSIDYTNMTAHKILRQTYKIVGDTINAEKYKTIQFGLLKSIVNSGDGKSCESGWSVIQVSEEYFILDMLGVELNNQSIDNNGGICDRMEVTDENGEKKTYYFEISNVFKGRENLKQK